MIKFKSTVGFLQSATRLRPLGKINGINYSKADEFVKTTFSKTDVTEASKKGSLTKDMIDFLILKRIPKTIKHTEKFVKQNPELFILY